MLRARDDMTTNSNMVLPRQDLRIAENDHGFTAPSRDRDDVGERWSVIVYDRTWAAAGMSYWEINCIARECGYEDLQVFSSRSIDR